MRAVVGDDADLGALAGDDEAPATGLDRDELAVREVGDGSERASLSHARTLARGEGKPTHRWSTKIFSVLGQMGFR
jgi:hypothetical protein